MGPLRTVLAAIALVAGASVPANAAVEPGASNIAFTSLRSVEVLGSVYNYTDIVVTDAAGLWRQQVTFTGTYSAPSWSRSSDAFLAEDGHGGIVLLRDGEQARLLGAGFSPTWSPDGDEYFFTRPVAGRSEIFVRAVSDGKPRQLTVNGGFDPAVSPDGRAVALVRLSKAGNGDIYTLDLKSRRLRAVSTAPADERHPTWSPDGRSIAFDSAVDGDRVVMATRLATSTSRPVIRGSQPAWGREGLLYTGNDFQIYLASGGKTGTVTHEVGASAGQSSWQIP